MFDGVYLHDDMSFVYVSQDCLCMNGYLFIFTLRVCVGGGGEGV